MVTYFNKSDLVKFGNFLLEDRKKRVLNAVDSEDDTEELTSEENALLWDVTHADVTNFLDTQKKVD